MTQPIVITLSVKHLTYYRFFMGLDLELNLLSM